MPARPAKEPVRVGQTTSPRARDQTRPETARRKCTLPELDGMLKWPLAERARGGSIELGAPAEGALGLVLAYWPAGAPGRTLLHVARSETRAERLARAATSFASGCEVVLVPPWDCLPYDRASPSRVVMGRRAGALSLLIEPAPPEGRLVITTIESLLQRVPPRTVWPEIRFEIRPGQAVEDLKIWLIRAGYVLDERVDEPGEAAIRGEVIDVFPADGEAPFRLELEGGQIGRIRRYDPLDQRSIGEAEGLQVGPASEAILAEAAVREYIGARGEAPRSDFLIGSPAAPRRVSGLEHRLALCYERLETLFDYLPDAAVSLEPEIEERRDAWLEQIADGFDARLTLQRNGSAAGAQPRPLEPQQLYLDRRNGRTGSRVVRSSGLRRPRTPRACQPKRCRALSRRPTRAGPSAITCWPGGMQAIASCSRCRTGRCGAASWPWSSAASGRRSSAWSTGPGCRACHPARSR
jgi:transcription-repair coupling factor (superfamily II helicase)